MRISVGVGTYVVAVSGGVDSMVLLDLLRIHPHLKLTVAHFDHGIRPDSAKDRKLVQTTARRYNLPFVYEAGKLGPQTSEAVARKARYEFLERVKSASGARAIITAHHQDDMLETAIINLLRGSGRRGLTALRNRPGLMRPLLDYNKDQIREYAKDHALGWNEDPTNADDAYLRNYIRAHVLPTFSDGQRAQLHILLERLHEINEELDNHLLGLLHIQPSRTSLDRSWFIELPHAVAKEILHAWLRQHGAKDVTKKTIERLVTAMKTGKIGQQLDIDNRYNLQIRRTTLALMPRDR